MPRLKRLAAAVLVLLAAAAPPTAQQLLDARRAHAADLAAATAAQAQAQLADAQAERLAADRVTAAARLVAAESALADAQQRVADLARRHDAAEAQLAADSRALGPLLPLIERLSLFPAETLLATPQSPQDAVRGVLVLGFLTRQLRARAARVGAERSEIAALQAQLDAALPGLQAAELSQRSQAAALDSALALARGSGQAARTQADAAARRAASDAARADSLRAAIAALDAARIAAARRREAAARAAPAQTAAAAAVLPPPPMAARGGWTPPAAGKIIRAFGAAGDAGPASGITLQTPSGARVVSPCAGRVEFAAPFRSYGLLLIIACGGDSHVVLAGLDRLDAAAGQAVRAGEPVGVMPRTGGGLYVELRRGGRPVDPAPYLHPAL